MDHQSCRQLWVVDSSRIATKIISASSDPLEVQWKSNPAIACPSCLQIMDNDQISQQWQGLPKGVKFDPSDQEIIEHLIAKESGTPHPFIDEFIETVDKEDGICYTHPENLPGVQKDGSVSHFFYKAIKAYNTGTRKRRKIQGEDNTDLRWHKTGKTKPVIMDGVQRGCKKIMVLYLSVSRGGKAEKTNWVMHQYHLGTEEDEKDGEYVISKVFYQQQQLKPGHRSEVGCPNGITDSDVVTVEVDPATPKSVTPEPSRIVKGFAKSDRVESTSPFSQLKQPSMEYAMEEGRPKFKYYSSNLEANDLNQNGENDCPVEDTTDHSQDGSKLWYAEASDLNQNGENDWPVEDTTDHSQDGSKLRYDESQELLNSQQLVEGLSLCDEFLQSQSPDRDGNVKEGASKCKPSLSDYARLGPEHFKRDLEECQKFIIDPANIETDTPPDFRMSQLEFGSQDSFDA